MKAMSLATLERAMLAGSRIAFNNPKLRMADVMEWSTDEVKPRDGEVVAWIGNPGVYVAIVKKDDRREHQKGWE
jgi:hypothetical protein